MPWNSRFRPWAREARPSRGYDPSPWWDHPRVLWQSRDDPEAEPLFALEDAAEGGRWDMFEQYRRLAKRSLRTALSVVADDLP